MRGDTNGVVEHAGRRTSRVVGLAFLVAGLALALAAGIAVGLRLGTRSEPTASPGPAKPASPAADALSDGPLEIEALGASCGLIAVQGDHADWLADGRYCRVRLAVTNTDRYVHEHDATRLEVVDDTGTAYEANLNATQIADQPTVIEMKVGNRLEFDAWFDVPEDARIVALRIAGQEGRLDLNRFEPYAGAL